MKDKDIKFINNSKALHFDPVTHLTDPIYVGDWRDLILTATRPSGGILGAVVVALGSTQKNPPDFTKPSTPDNSYTPIVLKDYSIQNTYYNGATGLQFPSPGMKIVELNTNLLTWVALRKTGSIECLLTLTNAQ